MRGEEKREKEGRNEPFLNVFDIGVMRKHRANVTTHMWSKFTPIGCLNFWKWLLCWSLVYSQTNLYCHLCTEILPFLLPMPDFLLFCLLFLAFPFLYSLSYRKRGSLSGVHSTCVRILFGKLSHDIVPVNWRVLGK